MELERAKLMLTRIGKLYSANTLLRNWVMNKPERIRGDFLADAIGPTLNFSLGIYQSIDDYTDNERHADELQNAINVWITSISKRTENIISSITSVRDLSRIAYSLESEHEIISRGVDASYLLIYALRWFNAFLLGDHLKRVDAESMFLYSWTIIHGAECKRLGVTPTLPTKQIQKQLDEADAILKPLTDALDLIDAITLWDFTLRLRDLLDEAELHPNSFTSEEMKELRSIEDEFYGLYPDPTIHYAYLSGILQSANN